MQAVTYQTQGSKILTVALTQLGVEEVPRGSNRGPKIGEYLASVGLPQGYAWCQSLVYWCGFKALGKANPVPMTGHVKDAWNKAKNKVSKEHATTANILPGSQFILDLGHGNGHTGLVVSVDADGTLHTIEGNSNNAGSREGYAVCLQHKRKLTDTKLLGFILYP